MENSLIIQGRQIGPAELERVRGLLAAHPEGSRYRLSRELCRVWNWRNPNGQIKDMAARALLGKLEERGWIGLPAAMRFAQPDAPQQGRPPPSPDRSDPRAFGELQPLQIQELSQQPEAQPVFDLLHQYHYLGYTSAVGQNVKYLVRDRQGRHLSCLLFGAAAWKRAGRDAFIGWSAAERQAHLRQVANNSRFIILPWVHVPELASHILGRVVRRLARDWRGATPLGWRCWKRLWNGPVPGRLLSGGQLAGAGQTPGRTRQDRRNAAGAGETGVCLSAARAFAKFVSIKRLQELLHLARSHARCWWTWCSDWKPNCFHLRQEMEASKRLARNSSNSGKPPSSDGLGKPGPKQFARPQRSQTRRPTRASGPYLPTGRPTRSSGVHPLERCPMRRARCSCARSRRWIMRDARSLNCRKSPWR